MLELDTVPTASKVDRSTRWAGLLIGLIAGQLVAYGLGGGEGLGILYAIPVFGLCAVAGVLVGDALTARPQGRVRTAGLAPRRVRDCLPPRLTRLLLVQAAILVVLLAVAAAVASPDDQGRAGRWLTLSCQADGTASYGPWPGLYYGLPLLVSVAVSTAACGWSLARIARRSCDERTRQERTRAIVAAWGLTVAAPLLGAAATASGALTSIGCAGATGLVLGRVLWPVAVSALISFLWCLFTVISPQTWGPRR
ncbi:hypothetical protein [Streptomyces sp. NPDC001020]